MYRKISDFLKSWKDSKYRKPLILQGARQVGKTYSLLEFGRNSTELVSKKKPAFEDGKKTVPLYAAFCI